jgi:type II secretory pathway predicted ATPase ExeA
VRNDTPAPPAPKPPSYDAFYGLHETPFGLSSDPRFFYPAASHDHVLNGMLAAVHASEGLIVMTGREGLGKTTICRTAARDLGRRTLQSLLLDPPPSIEQLLQTVLVDFGVVPRGDLARAPRVQREVLTATLASFVQSLATLQANAVIVIDEAQAMPEGVLAAFPGVVAALDSRRLQIVLASAPELASMVKRAGLRDLNGRSGVHLDLRPLAEDEIAPYVRHRLQVVDGRARVDCCGIATRLSAPRSTHGCSSAWRRCRAFARRARSTTSASANARSASGWRSAPIGTRCCAW